jgi:uncharacterized protein (TIGR02145 family)
LNQTNYAILAYNDVSPNTIWTASNSIILRNTNSNIFRITSNAGWKATITDPTDIMDHIIPATGGTDNSANSYSQDDYTLTGKSTANTKYKTATVLLEDNTASKRAKDYTVTVVQCQGTEDMDSVTKTATPDKTSAGDISWNNGSTPADKVVRHQAKSGVYDEFYSAYFGTTAGRWMTTNLTAWKYDTNITSPPTLPGSADVSSSYTEPRWCYPKADEIVTPGEFEPSTWRSNQGLLYNWSAATGNQNASTSNQGHREVDEGPATLIQGICPNGWHLPSDREWNELEKEIYTYPQLYSYYTDKTDWSTANWDSTWETTTYIYRPPLATEAQGKAMKDICGVNSNVPSCREPNKRVYQKGK